MTRTRLVRTDRYVVAVEVEMVIPDADPTGPCLEPESVRLLKSVQENAEAGSLEWLCSRGKVYESVDAA